jgi:porin
VPGDPDHPHGTHIKLGRGDGTLNIIELGYTPQTEIKLGEESEIFHKTAIGLWRYTAKFDDLEALDANGNPKRRHSQGAYILSEHTLYTEAGHPAQGLSGFVRFGTAGDDLYQADWTGSLGLRYHGLIAGRDDDIAGVAVTVNHTSDKYRRINDADNHETDWELTYRAQVNGWLAVQPNVQYIVNPGMDKTIDNAWTVGARVEVEF